MNRTHRQSIPRLGAEYGVTPNNGVLAELDGRPGLQSIDHRLRSRGRAEEPVEVVGGPSWIV